ncbi:septation protein A [Roseateles depolymerans]|uniref:Inner membrane-spanning protein YciB n=1 Tax=Roseateles depolymerans TaxID=76731 RepID=A0A0U3L3G6_9BURK|nr:septation protein A [Roseateles depolymerans]ALV05870.1 putative intracellular septation protein A [Roseateles depolymerans]REG12857.1 intracellular septation protein [Roseateles depolymerans]
MKLLLDFLPLLLFFATFKYADAQPEWAAGFATEHLGFLVSGGQVPAEVAPVLLATVVVMAATVAQVLFLKLTRRKVDLMLWISLVLVVVMGSATIYFHSEMFIKWKPSLLYWAFSLTFLVSHLVLGRNLLRKMLGGELQLPDDVWARLNWAWALFFGAMGFANLYVAYEFSSSAWANFKAFGSTGLIVLFTLAQGIYMSRHLPAPDEATDGAADAKEQGR